MSKRKIDILKNLHEKLGPDCSVEQEKSLNYFPELVKLFIDVTDREPGKSFRTRNVYERRSHLEKCLHFWSYVSKNSLSLMLNSDFDNRKTKNIESLFGKTSDSTDDVMRMNDVIKMISNGSILKIEELARESNLTLSKV